MDSLNYHKQMTKMRSKIPSIIESKERERIFKYFNCKAFRSDAIIKLNLESHEVVFKIRDVFKEKQQGKSKAYKRSFLLFP